MCNVQNNKRFNTPHTHTQLHKRQSKQKPNQNNKNNNEQQKQVTTEFYVKETKGSRDNKAEKGKREPDKANLSN